MTSIKSTLRLLFVAQVFLASQHGWADLQLEEFQAGLFTQKSLTELVLEPGERLLGNNEEITETRSVPAELGVKFGLRYSLAGKNLNGNRVTYLYLTPGVVNPDGSRNDKYEFAKELSYASPHHTIAYEFSEPYEIVEGIWQLMVFEGDRLLVREFFAVGVDESLIPSPPMKKPVTLKSIISPVKP